MRRVLPILWLIAIALALAFAVISSTEPPIRADLIGVLSWTVIEPGFMALLGVGLSYLLEVLPRWGSLPSGVRGPAVFGLSVILGLAGAFGLVQEFKLGVDVPELFEAVVDVLTIWIATQLTYERILGAEMRQPRRKP